MKIAIAHHWVMSYRGGEKVLEQIAGLFPLAPVYLLTHDKRIDVPGLRQSDIVTSGLQNLPKISKFYKHLLPAHPAAISRLRVPSDTELLLSSDASLIKGIPLGGATKHVCYCHSPARYLWELTDEYKRTSLGTRMLLDRFLPGLKKFDFEAAQRVDHFIANSQFVAGRIKKYYGRESDVVYPPVAVDDFSPDRARKDFYLVLSELTPYKRIDLAVAAFANTDRKLVIIGDGSERRTLEKIATPNITFLGRQPFAVVKEHFETARAFVFPGIEDFGITPVEAQASGCPVIAYNAGGALETVVEGETGTFFDIQSPESLQAALSRFESTPFRAADCAENARRFSAHRFQAEYLEKLNGYTDGKIGTAMKRNSISVVA